MATLENKDFFVKNIRTGETKVLQLANKVEQIYMPIDFSERKRGKKK